MYMYICIYMHISIYVYIHTHICTCIRYIDTYTYMCDIFIYVYIYMILHIHTHIYLQEQILVCIHIFIQRALDFVHQTKRALLIDKITLYMREVCISLYRERSTLYTKPKEPSLLTKYPYICHKYAYLYTERYIHV